jgi:hypothetical protein
MNILAIMDGLEDRQEVQDPWISTGSLGHSFDFYPNPFIFTFTTFYNHIVYCCDSYRTCRGSDGYFHTVYQTHCSLRGEQERIGKYKPTEKECC